MIRGFNLLSIIYVMIYVYFFLGSLLYKIDTGKDILDRFENLTEMINFIQQVSFYLLIPAGLIIIYSGVTADNKSTEEEDEGEAIMKRANIRYEEMIKLEKDNVKNMTTDERSQEVIRVCTNLKLVHVERIDEDNGISADILQYRDSSAFIRIESHNGTITNIEKIYNYKYEDTGIGKYMPLSVDEIQIDVFDALQMLFRKDSPNTPVKLEEFLNQFLKLR